MASFYIPLTGLESNSTALNTIANDLANLSTTGFKAQTVNFSDLFYQQLGNEGSGDPIQEGSGVATSSIESQYTQGSIVASGNATDVAIDGNGFFVLNNGGTNIYTRDGNFALNNAGDLITQSGLGVKGYPAVGGVVNPNSPLTPIVIPVGQVEPPQASTSFGMTANLDATSAVGTTVPGQLTLYDSLGSPQVANVTYTKTGANTWSYAVTMPQTLGVTSTTTAGVTSDDYTFGTSGGVLSSVDPTTNLTITGPTATGTATTLAPAVIAGETVAAYAAAVTAAVTAAGITGVTVTATAGGGFSIVGTGISTTGALVQDPVATGNTGTLTFNANGNLVAPAADVPGITFGGLSDGAATMTLSFDVLGPTGSPTITQDAATSQVSATTQNGFSSGQYQSFSIAADGTVEAAFSNGQSLAVGKLALASVSNLQGLDLLGGGDYATTLASGTASVGASGTNGLGTFEDSALEESNVNISAEFSDLIIAQRAFEANSKAVTTFDTVAQEVINMIH
jgi:flagellar hook protein FlgE